jgi:hypothetical protein
VGGKGEEMTQTLCAHMNKTKIFLKSHNSCHQERKEQQILGRIQEKRNKSD